MQYMRDQVLDGMSADVPNGLMLHADANARKTKPLHLRTRAALVVTCVN